MRLFIAIDAQELNFDPEIAFKKLKKSLKMKELEYRWVPQKNFHITLNFLGEVDEAKLPSLKKLLGELVEGHSTFSLKLDGLGAFPSLKEGRVIWMDVQNSKQLRSLQSDCEQRLRSEGFELEERDYKPHLTLVRLRNSRNLSDMLSPLIKQNFGELKVDKVTLFESKLGGPFPVYEPLENFDLK